MSYAELLSDPRWQRKRLEIMERDKWTCQTCGDAESTLTAHHKSYRNVDGKFANPWDYESSHIITLCEECHSKEESRLKEIQKSIYFDIRGLCENAAAIDDAVDFLVKLRNMNDGVRLTGEDIFRSLSCDRNSLHSQLTTFTQELVDDAIVYETGEFNSLIDCCNFVIINGLDDGGER